MLTFSCSEGEEIDDEKKIKKPEVLTLEATTIFTISANLNAKLSNDGGAIVTARGFYWSNISQEPDSTDNVELFEGKTSNFSVTIKGLTEEHTYYFRSFAKNIEGTALGEVYSFTTPVDNSAEIIDNQFRDARDGHTYQLVTIDGVTWMAENLSFLPSVLPPSEGSNSKPYFYVLNYEGIDVNYVKASDEFMTYGVLYNFEAAKNACPKGWHLPTEKEWRNLQSDLVKFGYGFGYGDSSNIAKSMASKSFWQNSNNPGAIGSQMSTNNRSGFTALPGGRRSRFGSFTISGENGYWWTATEYANNFVWYVNLNYSEPNLLKNYNYREEGMSVRCVKDNTF